MQIPETTMADWTFWHRAFYTFFPRFLIPYFLSKYFQFEVHHKNYLNNFPEGTPVIYCINHRSHLDGFIAGSAVVVPRGLRTRIALMGAGNIMQENWLFRLLPYLGVFPIYPEKSETSLNFAVKLLKQGVGIVIAPQGKRIIGTPYHDYFNLAKEGKTGVGRLILALNGKIPVIPAYIHGAAEALSRGKIIPKFCSYISVSFGPPIFWREYTRNKGWKNTDPDFFSTAREIADKIMVKIRDQMIIEEKSLFTILERSFGTTIDKITIPTSKKRKFDKQVFKLLKINPRQLQRLLKGECKDFHGLNVD
ncbi:MAG: lysophospholipid acyltransferase family protein [Candidatus Hodarchaeales archaeon]|jgi:1-acyl-sn-glycerol-3-phosphate acyltransferase